jgi:hypothetical protein
VGGHGKFLASVLAGWPLVSVPVAGGPTVPSTIANVVVGTVPPVVVVMMCASGFEHETGALARLATVTVGCVAAELHSMATPSFDTSKPEPETFTVAPFARPDEGVTLSVPATVRPAAANGVDVAAWDTPDQASTPNAGAATITATPSRRETRFPRIDIHPPERRAEPCGFEAPAAIT